MTNEELKGNLHRKFEAIVEEELGENKDSKVKRVNDTAEKLELKYKISGDNRAKAKKEAYDIYKEYINFKEKANHRASNPTVTLGNETTYKYFIGMLDRAHELSAEEVRSYFGILKRSKKFVASKLVDTEFKKKVLDAIRNLKTSLSSQLSDHTNISDDFKSITNEVSNANGSIMKYVNYYLGKDNGVVERNIDNMPITQAFLRVLLGTAGVQRFRGMEEKKVSYSKKRELKYNTENDKEVKTVKFGGGLLNLLVYNMVYPSFYNATSVGYKRTLK